MRLDSVAVLGGGPGGLYTARLLKLRMPDCDVRVLEQTEPAHTFGFGVGLATRTQRNLLAADPESFDQILAAAHAHEMAMVVDGRTVALPADNLIAVGRARLLDVLRDHARAAGVTVEYGQRAFATELADRFDLVVAADGVSSATREDDPAYGGRLVTADGLYLWAGTDVALPSAIFAPVATEHGTFVAHAYPYAADHSTFLVETDEVTWRRAGFDVATEQTPWDADDRVSLDYLSEAFAEHLHGHRLLGNRTRWLRFRTVTCRRWHHGNVVLLGDAVHTAHYSIGSGTKLAMEDGIALVEALAGADDLAAALAAYEEVRRPAVEHLQETALRSMRWWDSFPTRLDLPVERLWVSYMTRAGKVTLDQFGASAPDVVRTALAAYAGCPVAEVPDHGLADWALARQPAAPPDPAPVAVDVEDPWGPAADALVKEAGDGPVLLSGPADQASLLTMLDVGERLRRETGATVVAAVPADQRDLAAAALVSGRADCVTLVPPDYRAAGLWGSRTLPAELAAVVATHADRTAVVADEGSLTYAELDAWTDRIGAGLLGLGLEPGDRVLLQVTNRLESVVAWWALLKAALVPVATLAQHREHEIGEIARLCGARGHLVEAGLSFDLVAFGERMGIEHLLVLGGGFESLGADLDPDAARATLTAAQAHAAPDDLAVLQLSGGTTGTPKLIPRRHAEYWYNAAAYAERLGWTSATRVAHLIPVVHNAGVTCAVHAAASVGATLVLGTPDPTQWVPLLARAGADAALIGHGHFSALTQTTLDVLPRLRQVVLSGAKVPDALFGELERRGIWSGQLFGMGEGLFVVSSLDDPREARLRTVGTPLSPLDEVRLLVPGTEDEVAAGEVGELCCRGPYTITAYHLAPEHDRTAFTSDGLYRTGDLARWERFEDGRDHLHIEGRIKDVISRGGEKVNAEEVERLLLAHPDVSQAAVVAMPDPRLGERACAFLVATAPLGVPDLQEHLAGLGVAKFKWPEHVVLVDDLPRTNVGKVDKAGLRRSLSASS